MFVSKTPQWLARSVRILALILRISEPAAGLLSLCKDWCFVSTRRAKAQIPWFPWARDISRAFHPRFLATGPAAGHVNSSDGASCQVTVDASFRCANLGCKTCCFLIRVSSFTARLRAAPLAFRRLPVLVRTTTPAIVNHVDCLGFAKRCLPTVTLLATLFVALLFLWLLR